ncbi:C40 family peptidase [Streptomyces physcomitrii]|uniref:NlpC/P60 family protein n=1 Tax=Streptomyces physcomitrii TaxID=2724184 RepID=A0ABX1H0H3_9ACTN|nr:C40 family peptidase [Streptomyces physcomitrii]NKI40561.1 NlpC/P60 family protein [Streptomyces physcomitrii]
MAAQRRKHRKPGRRLLGGSPGRTAAALAVTGATAATALGGTSQAAPEARPGEVRAQVDRLYRQAEVATEKYNGAKEKADAARASLRGLREEAARTTERLDSTRAGLASLATAQYREGTLDPALQLVMSADPEEYLRGTAVAERASHRQAAAVGEARGQLRKLARLRGEAGRVADRLGTQQSELARSKRAVQEKLGRARQLLDRLTAEERAAATRQDGRASRGRARTATPAAAPAPPPAAPGSRAGAAVAYAYRALGKPYVWGATGPNSFDCSGLIQAAYRAAGVALPRTTYSQINAGTRIGRGQLRPGDLVFFYSGISHVGIYVGGGKMIHAPRPGAPVRIAPISQMPFAGAARVA